MNNLNNSFQAQLKNLKQAVEEFIKQRNEIERTNRDYIFIVDRLEREILKSTLNGIEHLPIENNDFKKLKKRVKSLTGQISTIQYKMDSLEHEIIFKKPVFKMPRRRTIMEISAITFLISLTILTIKELL